MSRRLNEPVLAKFHEQTKYEHRIRSVIEALHEQGIRISNIRCICCHTRLVDLAHITVTPEGPLGPECSKPGHNFRCRLQPQQVKHG